MKKKEIGELKAKSVKELEGILGNKKVEAVDIYAKIKAGKEKNIKKVRLLKREIAIILTILGEKKIIEGFNTQKEKQAK